MRTLVVGCDASGKSTFLESIRISFEDTLIESTSTDASRAFKRANIDRLVDSEFIDKREQLYLELTRETLAEIKTRDIKSFVGTDATLVTRLSHTVMRRCINGELAIDNDLIVKQWIDDEAKSDVGLPDIITLTHAPFSLIRDRISARQQAGNKDEKFWGFNSPFFLCEYQAAWRATIPALARAGFTCLSFDSSITTPEQMIEEYSIVRSSLSDKPGK